MNYPAVLDEWTHKNNFCLFGQIARQKYNDCLARFSAWPDYFSHSVGMCAVLDDRFTAIVAGGMFLFLCLSLMLPPGRTAVRFEAARELHEGRLRAEQAGAAKSLMLAVASHEIRTLLYGMLASIELIGKTRLDDVQTQLSAAMACSARTLKDVLNNTLDFTRGENQAIEIVRHEFDLRREIEAAVQAFGARASLKGLQLRCRIDPALAGLWWGDSLKLTQILNNFLNNAVKFTVQGGIDVSAELTGAAGGDAGDSGDSGDGSGNGGNDGSREEQEIALSVRDTGPGMAGEDIDGIFRLFGRARTPASGAGLGLYLCKQFAAAMDGAIELRSTPSAGSTFTLRLALRRGKSATANSAGLTTASAAALAAAAAIPLPHPAARRAATPAGRRQAALHVLVVDDQPINRLLLEKQLRYFGCAVTTAAGGREALAHETCFDAILTDLNMPGLDGYALTRIWRAGGIGCPIFAVSADHSAAERERCLAAGMDGYLAKPFMLDDLAQLLEPHLDGRVGRHAARPPDNALQRWAPDTMRIAASALTLDLGELAECAAAADIVRLRSVVHRIHGGMALLEMRPAVALCRAIEESIEFDWRREALQLTPLLRDMLAQIRDDIDPGEAAPE